MIIDNRTRYVTADLERIILGALNEFGVTKHARDRVLIKPGPFSGWCYFGHVQLRGKVSRMVLRIPNAPPPSLAAAPSAPAAVRAHEPLDLRRLVWLVRHEVGHWAGLDHKQMNSALRYWSRERRRRTIVGDVGSERPIPTWAEGMTVAVVGEVAPISRRVRVRDPDAVRSARLDHATAKLAEAERKAKTAAMLVKRWRRRVASAKGAIERAARKRAAA